MWREGEGGSETPENRKCRWDINFERSLIDSHRKCHLYVSLFACCSFDSLANCESGVVRTLSPAFYVTAVKGRTMYAFDCEWHSLQVEMQHRAPVQVVARGQVLWGTIIIVSELCGIVSFSRAHAHTYTSAEKE